MPTPPSSSGRSEPERIPDFADDFVGDGDAEHRTGLSTERWVDHYLPHWTTPDRSRARYRLDDGGLALLIEPDRPPWRPEDAPLVVSSIQTGTFSGRRGTATGIHRHRPDGMIVRTPQRRRMTWAPRSGRVEVTLSPALEPGVVTAAWLVGTEEASPSDSGEICLVELEPERASTGTPAIVARTGLKAHGDQRMTTQMVHLGPDPAWQGSTTWSAVWGEEGTVTLVDGREVFRSTQSPRYPLILLIGVFRVSGVPLSATIAATVRRVRGWSEPG